MVLKWTVTAVLVVGAAEAGAGGQGISLRPEFVVGQVTEYLSRGTITHQASTEDMPPSEPVRITTESGMQVKVARLRPEGGAEIEWTLRYVVIKTTEAVPGIPMKLDYDSREPGSAQSPLAPMFAELVGRPITIEVDASGRVLGSRNMPVGGPQGVLGDLLGGFFSPEMFEQLPLFITAGAPSPAKKNSKWNRALRIPLPLGAGSIDFNTIHKLSKVNRRESTALIAIEGDIAKGAVSGATAQPAPDRTVVIHDGRFTGSAEWDTALGQLKSAESRMSLNLTLDTLLGRMNVQQEMISSVERTKTSRPDQTKTPKNDSSEARP
ncbi:MAG: hypothetical protein IID34_00715 [Planctomycetes bacterium]|nr:hypothetical protein [Planctomycetota bacterium]